MGRIARSLEEATPFDLASVPFEASEVEAAAPPPLGSIENPHPFEEDEDIGSEYEKPRSPLEGVDLSGVRIGSETGRGFMIGDEQYGGRAIHIGEGVGLTFEDAKRDLLVRAFNVEEQAGRKLRVEDIALIDLRSEVDSGRYIIHATVAAVGEGYGLEEAEALPVERQLRLNRALESASGEERMTVEEENLRLLHGLRLAGHSDVTVVCFARAFGVDLDTLAKTVGVDSFAVLAEIGRKLDPKPKRKKRRG